MDAECRCLFINLGNGAAKMCCCGPKIKKKKKTGAEGV
jgi:hypothetical protein